MPIYEYRCDKCGEVSELLILGSNETPACTHCGSEELSKLMSAHNTPGSSQSFSAPEAGSCCGSPNSCGSPGSCCSG
jgi:putative FmdB family regulatory protein